MPKGHLCPDCGELHFEAGPRCARHQAEHDARDNRRRHAKQRAHGRDRRDVRRAMKAAIARDGACAYCGATEDLTAHLDEELAGEHTTDPDDYTTACRSCHGRVDGRRATRPRGTR